MTGVRKKAKPTLPLEYVPCIHYLLCFEKDQVKVKALLDSNNKVNIVTPAYTAKLGLNI